MRLKAMTQAMTRITVGDSKVDEVAGYSASGKAHLHSLQDSSDTSSE
jgi:hypothetical protein